MSRRENAAVRCAHCRLHVGLCICSKLPRIETKTRVVLVIHRFEDRKSTNTGRIATQCLSNSEVVLRGGESDRGRSPTWDPGTSPVVLFPCDEAVPLERYADRPVTLIIPDGNWRQASKVKRRIPALASVPCAILPRGAPSQYRLRAETHDGGLSTLEAIARALGILEGPDVQAALEHVLTRLVERTLWARGTIGAADVTHGVPDGAKRHDPTSGTVGKPNEFT
jgi:DTW domain-containing protein YfiP